MVLSGREEEGGRRATKSVSGGQAGISREASLSNLKGSLMAIKDSGRARTAKGGRRAAERMKAAETTEAMATETTEESDAEDLLTDCRTCDQWDDVKGRMRVAETIAKSVDAVQESIESGEFQPTVAEYLKLVQIEQEWDDIESQEDGPKEIKVTWVEAPSDPQSEG
jgi:hypothetical protein